MTRLFTFILWLLGRTLQCNAELDAFSGGKFRCTLNGGHPGWHRCKNIKWEP